VGIQAFGKPAFGARRKGRATDQAQALGILVALSRGAIVPRERTVEAGRLAAQELLRSGIEVFPLGDSGNEWRLDRLSDAEAATLAVRLATQLADLQKSGDL
jgi:hypothetical protein